MEDFNITNELFKIQKLGYEREEQFVTLINSLSGSIKNYMKSFRDIIRSLAENTQFFINELVKCKSNINEINKILGTLSNHNLSKILKDRNNQTIQGMDNLYKINQEMINEIKDLDNSNINFYDQAKEIFKQLKEVHNRKLEDLNQIIEQSKIEFSSYKNQNITNYQKLTKSNNHTKNQSVSPKHKLNQNINNNIKTNYQTYSNVMHHSKLSHSNDHFGNKGKNIKQNKNLNINNSNNNISTSQFNDTRENSNITMLTEINKELKIELETTKNENDELKKNIMTLKTSFDKLKSTLPKSKSLRNFLSPKHDINENNNNNNISFELANDILSFLQKMKDLQNAIMKKNPNVNEMKKDFEKFKNDLKDKAIEISGKEYSKSKTSSKKEINENEKELNINSIKEENESLKNKIKELENIIRKLNNNPNNNNNNYNNNNNNNENKRVLSNQAKLKDFENKISNLRNENEKIKKNLKENEETIKKLTNELQKKEQILSMPKADNSETKKENERLKALLEECKNLNIKYKTQLDEQNNKNNDEAFRKLKNQKEETELKNETIMNELSNKEQQLNDIKDKMNKIEKENKDFENKILSLDSELKDTKEINEKLIKEKEELLSKNNKLKSENEEIISKLNNDANINSLNIKNDKKGNNINQEQILKLNDECNNYKNEIIKLNNEIKKLSKSLSDEKEKIKEKDSQIISLKMNLGKNLNKDFDDFNDENYKKELLLCANMIKNIHSLLNNKQKELIKNKQKKNQNDAFIMDEDEKEEIENILNNNNNEIKDFKNISDLLSKLNNYNKEINQNIDIIVNIAKRSIINNNLSNLKINNNNNDNKNQKINKELEEENKFLKGVINECVSTIFESIKKSAPNMVEDDENTFGINIGNDNIPINILDNKKQLNDNNFDPDVIQDAVNKFKEYNIQINEQIRQLEEEKEKFEKEAHSNLVTANVYKNTLDDAINKMNHNINEENNQKSNNNKSEKEDGRTFTVEDLENPQDDNKSNKKSIQENKKINSELINMDLVKKLKAKEEECKKHQEIINNLLSINNGIGENLNSNQMVISAEKYQQLLQLYSSEQEKNQELRASYFSFINEQSDLIKEKKINEKKYNIMNKNDDKLLDSDEDEKEINLNIKNKNEDILFEDHEFDKKNKTHNIISNKGIDYLGMLNQDQNQRLHSQGNNSNINYQEILDENKDLKENENLLLNQLNSIKDELKETREQVNILVQDNTTLKEELQAAKTLKNEEVIGPLRSALERLIMEIKLTQKIKEILTVILKLACYTEDQIFTIYYYREKKKNFDL